MAHRMKIFRVFAIDVALDASWILCAGLIGVTLAQDVFPGVTPDLDPSFYWWMALGATLGLFASIVLHELAHSLVARHFGIPVHAIVLFIFGGMAEMEEEPRTARSELLIAAAGPIASLLLAGAAFLGETAAIAWDAPDSVVGLLWYLAFANIVLAMFNLIPAFPLDGGRIFRAALWAWRGDLIRATAIASAVGGAFGIGLMALGCLDIATGDVVGGAWRFLIGLFLRGAAASGREELTTRSLMAGIPVSAAMNRSPVAVPADLSIDALIDHVVYRFPHRCFPVTAQGRLIGTVVLERISLIDPEHRRSTSVCDIMVGITDQETVAPESDLPSACRRMRREGHRRLWVVRDGELVGILSAYDLNQYLLAHAALAAPGPARRDKASGKTCNA